MKRILLSRTDSIGDVVLTLPMAGVLKQCLPGTEIFFLGSSYTKPVVEACRHVDRFVDWDSIKTLPWRKRVDAFRALRTDVILHVFMVMDIAMLADAAGIPVRIGTTHRLFTWFFCNTLVWLSRKSSDLHEAQLNLRLLKPLGIDLSLSREEIPSFYGLKDGGPGIKETTPPPVSRSRLILHPKSRGSAREWGLENFSRLIGSLPADRYDLYVTGTSAEGALMKDFLESQKDRITDMTGKLNLSEFMNFIRGCDGLVAASTGPLHLAAAFGKAAIGLYAPMRPIHPARWGPLGEKATYIVLDKTCNDCRKTLDCHCMKEIRPEEVAEQIRRLV